MIAATPYHCTSQPNIRIKNRQKKNRKREADPARKAAVKGWCKGQLCTCGCGQPANCAHHPNDTLYGDEWADLSQCEPWQSFCHHMHHKGFVRCPECGGWMRHGHEMCSKCRKVSRATRRRHNRHPCPKNLGNQRCAFSWSPVCSFSPQRATECDWYASHLKTQARTGATS